MAEHEAKREPYLHTYFISTPYYDEIREAQTLIVYASRGCGKSAHRIMVARDCRPYNPSSTTLGVEYTSFGNLAEWVKNGRPLTAGDHIRLILDRATLTLVETLANDVNLAKCLSGKGLQRLRWFWDTFCPVAQDQVWFTDQLHAATGAIPVYDWRAFDQAYAGRQLTVLFESQAQQWKPAGRFWLALADAPPAAIDENSRSPLFLWQSFMRLVRQAGLTDACILIDEVDERPPLTDNPDFMADFLAPLLADLDIMEADDTAFKLFLPADLQTELHRRPGVRIDRLPTRSIVWNDESLAELLRQRLVVFSDTRVSDFEELCEPDCGALLHTNLIKTASEVPRNLIELCDSLIVTHARRQAAQPTEPVRPLLTWQEWETIQSDWKAGMQSSVITGVPLLRFDKATGRIRVGARESVLTGRLLELFSVLYDNAGEVVENEDLIDIFDGDSALRRVLSRLRDLIEPKGADEPIYLATVRGRGVQLNHVAKR
ncbi:winged helix-turn-helix domain-containing protein [Candidatus Amarolinea dominans]|uniref:winged helix-turn-helix domain-containing protein n=1 Tax=Candidatus Amarolinea dominans TaxID=3140696 RepID=UPI001E01785E|nr:winged helix-turn-helix transcriptional regulator [Anaerolineae bacterium]